MSLNILYHHRTQGRGAEGVHISSMVTALQALGHRVTVLSPPGVDPMNPDSGAPVDKTSVRTGGVQSLWKWVSRQLPNALFELAEVLYNLPAWWRLRRVLSDQRFDLVYERYAFYLVAGAIAARARGIPFVLEANEVSGIEQRARRQSYPSVCARFERIVFARCTAIHAVSSHLKERIARQGVDPDRVRLAANAFDVGRVKDHQRCTALQEQLGLGGKTVFGFAGWFDAWDRLDMLVDACAELAQRHDDARLLLIGDGPVVPALREQVQRLGLRDKVVFTGAVPRQRVFDYIALLDVAVLAHSNSFGSPVVMFEFMGLRVPVVAPRLAPILDVQRDGETALLFDPLDRQQCVAAIERLFASVSLRRSLAEAAWALLAAEHTWQRNATEVLASAGFAASARGGSQAAALEPLRPAA